MVKKKNEIGSLYFETRNGLKENDLPSFSFFSLSSLSSFSSSPLELKRAKLLETSL